MADIRFLRHLQDFPKDRINSEIVDLIEPYLNFHMYTIQQAITACGQVSGLLKWTIAMKDFFSVNKDVLPLKVKITQKYFKM